MHTQHISYTCICCVCIIQHSTLLLLCTSSTAEQWTDGDRSREGEDVGLWDRGRGQGGGEGEGGTGEGGKGEGGKEGVVDIGAAFDNCHLYLSNTMQAGGVGLLVEDKQTAGHQQH